MVAWKGTTNVPPQALALLNDPFVVGRAVFADRLIAENTVESRLDSMFRAALGRLPDDTERARSSGWRKKWLVFIRRRRKLLDGRDVWKDMAHRFQSEGIHIFSMTKGSTRRLSGLSRPHRLPARCSRLASNGFGLMALSALMAEKSYAGLAAPKLHFVPK
jgi:hypothetical protein